MFKMIGIALLALILGLACVAGMIRLQMNAGRDKWIATAQATHPRPDDDLAALLAYLESDAHCLRDRNQVAWAIGIMRDSRALPILEKYYTGGECDHDNQLCQHELEKAIRLCTR